MIKRILAVGTVLAVLGLTTVMASAESATIVVTAGSLSLTTDPVALPGITLNGLDQTPVPLLETTRGTSPTEEARAPVTT